MQSERQLISNVVKFSKVHGGCAMTTYKVGYLIGSLATKSINRKLAKALIRLAPESLQFTEISFRDLPLYSYDYDDNYPLFNRVIPLRRRKWLALERLGSHCRECALTATTCLACPSRSTCSCSWRHAH
jgi:hypothetical protein